MHMQVKEVPINVGPRFELPLELALEGHYRKPCRRIAPGCREARGWERGSLFVKENEIVLVLCPEDTTLNVPCNKVRVVGPPARRFKGLMMGSRLVRKGMVTYFCRKHIVSGLRKSLKDMRMTSQRNGAEIPSDLNVTSVLMVPIGIDGR